MELSLPISAAFCSTVYVTYLLQIARWQHKRAHSDLDNAGGAINNNAQASRRRLFVTLQDESQQAAALAVLAALYAIKPLPDLLSPLSQEQQLQAAVLADMWQIPQVSTAVVQVLSEAAGQEGSGLSAPALSIFLNQHVWPACLLPLLPCVAAACVQRRNQQCEEGLTRVLLSVLGDLEEVWADDTLQATLLALPLAAMNLLLSSNKLKVHEGHTAGILWI